MTSQTAHEIAALVVEKQDVPENVTDTFLTKEISAFGLDSLDNLELIMAIEDKYDVMLDEGKVMECETVLCLAALVNATRASKA